MSLSPPRTAQREGMVASMVLNLDEWFNAAESFLFGFHPSCPPGLLNTHYHLKVCCFLVPVSMCVCMTQDSSSKKTSKPKTPRNLRNKRKKKDIYVCITESLCYTPETNTTLYINFLKSLSCIQFFATLWTIYSPWNSPGHNTGVGSLALLQWIFPTQGSNPGLPHCRQIPYQLSHKGSPILEWVAYPFSSGSSWPKYQTRVSWIAGGFFTNWSIREAKISFLIYIFISILHFFLWMSFFSKIYTLFG